MTGQQLGAKFEAELIASVRALWGDKCAERCKIPDEKRPHVRGSGDALRYYGEIRVADLAVILPGGRTLWIEAKATGSHDAIRTVRLRQWESLRFLSEQGHEAWLLLNWRTQEPPFVNECIGLRAHMALTRQGKSIPQAWARDFGVALKRIAVQGARSWGWDLRALTRRDYAQVCREKLRAGVYADEECRRSRKNVDGGDE